jgi:hypothetical protein
MAWWSIEVRVAGREDSKSLSSKALKCLRRVQEVEIKFW